MSSVEGSIVFALVLGIAVALAVAAGRKITEELIDRKGYIGFVFVCIIAGSLLWLNARLIAGYLGISTSEVQLLAIIVFVALILVFVWRNRESTTRAAQIGARVTRKTTTKVKKKTSRGR